MRIREKIERFCYRHPRFGVPNLMRWVVIAGGVFWLFGLVNPVLLSYTTFSPALILRGQLWRLVTFIFYPPSRSMLALIALYFYYWIGTTLENQWGTGPFTIYFLTGVVLTILYGFLVYFLTGISVQLDSVYLYLSMFFSFAALFPDTQVLFLFFIPLKMKYLAIANAVFFVFSMITTAFPFNLLPLVAVLNFLIFCWDDLRRMLPRRKSRETINFKRESARIRREQQARNYTHKCAVCGRTDTEYPNLEFRYCSRCAGYHCFCSEHINNHIHFTE